MNMMLGQKPQPAQRLTWDEDAQRIRGVVYLHGHDLNPFIVIQRVSKALHQAGAGSRNIELFRVSARYEEVLTHNTEDTPDRLIEWVLSTAKRYCDIA